MIKSRTWRAMAVVSVVATVLLFLRLAPAGSKPDADAPSGDGTTGHGASVLAPATDGDGGSRIAYQRGVGVRVLAAPTMAPVFGATIVASSDGRTYEPVTTDEAGTASVSTGGVQARLAVTAPGYRPGTVLVRPSLHEIDVLLDPLVGVTGVVTLPDGTPVGPGLTVLAFRDQPTSAEISLAMREDPVGARAAGVTVTGEAGEFDLPLLPSGTSFHLVAGGSGLLSQSHVLLRTPLEEVAQLVVTPLLGVRLELVDGPTGEPARVSDRLWGKGTGQVKGRSGRAHVNAFSIPQELAGVDLGLGQEEYERRYMYWDNSLLGKEELEYSAHFPGYAPIRLAFEATPVTGRLRTVKAALVPTVYCWGALKLIYKNLRPAASSESTMTGGRLKATLYGPEANHSFLFGELREEGHEVSALPCGEYQLVIRSITDDLRMPAEGAYQVTIRNGERTTVKLDLGELGSLGVSVLTQAGEPYSGPVRFEVDPLDSNMDSDGFVGLVRFSAPPYTWRGLPPGPYRVQLIEPEYLTLDQGTGDGIIWVDAGFDRKASVRLEH